jgi:dTDP-4-dehydrorhamnose reductase
MILVTGANGQLGTSLRKVTSNGLFMTSKEFDLKNLSAMEKVIEGNEVTHIINCGAYTNVEKSEVEIDQAFAVNKTGPANLANISEKFNIPLIHISTDYVFDGTHYLPYGEDHATNPLNVYGRSKLEGEQAIIASNARAIIIRTSWVYSVSDDNFVGKIINLLKSKPELSIVADQIGTPTFSDDLASAIMQIIAKSDFKGVDLFHYSNEGTASWYDFAHYIGRKIGSNVPIKPVSSEKFPTVAKRPPFTVLSKEKIKREFNININHWTESLDICLSQKQY